MNPNEPAFPVYTGDSAFNAPGITIRDHIAIQAMKSVIVVAGPRPQPSHVETGAWENAIAADDAALAYKYADAMIAESQKQAS